jgi:hypothetical protein
MTDWDVTRTINDRQTTLAFAVRLVDAFTGGQPEDVTVELADEPATPVRNPSGYHVFVNLDADVVTVVVDGDGRYRDERRTVVLPDAPDDATTPDDAAPSDETVVVTDASEPVEIELTPTPSYSFPKSTTVIRGHVETADGTPVAGASVSLREFDPVVETTETGEYALWVPATGEDVRRRDGRNVVVVDGSGGNGQALTDGDGADPTLVVRHLEYDERAEAVEVDAGTKTVHYVTVE